LLHQQALLGMEVSSLRTLPCFVLLPPFCSRYLGESGDFDMTPFGMTIIAIAVAAGLLTWWIVAQERREKR